MGSVLRALLREMAPHAYVSTYQGDFGGRSGALNGGRRRGPSMLPKGGSASGGLGLAASKPLSWSTSSLGSTHTSGRFNKFSPGEWANSNVHHYNSADASRHQSERVRGEALRLIADRDRLTLASQRVADHHLADRLRDATSWRSELASELDRNRNQTNLLLKTRAQLEHAMKETEHPLRVNSENIYTREGRMGIDRVSDAVEANLHSEVDTIKQSQAMMAQALEQVNQQISANRNARHQVQLDLNNKDHALEIDHGARNLHNNSRGLNLHSGVERVDATRSIPETWASHSMRNIQESQGARSRSQRLSAEVENLVTTRASHMQQHWDQTNKAFQARVAETTQAQARLKSHLSTTMQEIYDQEKHIQQLESAVRSMGPPLKVAQTRLALRASRPEVEACRDRPHHGLVKEVGQIQESIGLLNDKLREAQTAHQDLLRNKS